MTNVRVSGELATIVIKTEFTDIAYEYGQDGSPEQELIRLLTGERQGRGVRMSNAPFVLQAQFDATIKEAFGRDVVVDKYAVRRGSVEIVLVVTAVYKLVKDFNDIVDTIAKATENVRRVWTSFMIEHNQNAVNTTVTKAEFAVGKAISDAKVAAAENAAATSHGSVVASQGRLPAGGLVTLYFAVTNVALIGALLYLAIKS